MNKIFKSIWNKKRGSYVTVSEVVASTTKSAASVLFIGGASLLLTSTTGYCTEYSGQQKFTGYVLNAGETDIFRGGTSQRGRWETYGTMIVYDYVLMSGSNPSGGNCDDVVIHQGGAYRLMENGVLIASKANGGDESAHGFQNYGTLYTAAGSQMQFSSPFSTIQNYASSYAEINGSLELSGLIDNASSFVTNGAVTVLSEGRVQNAGIFTNNSKIDFAGTWTGNGTFINNGTFNLNAGSFNQEIKGNGRFIYAGGSFYSPLISENLILQINKGLSATVGNANNANIDNYGNFQISSGTLNSVINQQEAIFNFTGASISSLSNYGEARVNADLTIKGAVINSGSLDTSGKWIFNGGSLSSNGTIKTDNAFNIFDSLGSQGQTALSTVSLKAALPEEAKTALTDLFRHYVPGSVAQSLIEHASFTGGKVIVTGVNLTTTQRDDLVKAFKEKFFLLIS